jgi:CHAT domain-containing protein
MSSGARVSRQDDSPEIKLSAATSPLSWKQVQQSLPAETQLLEYTVLDDRVIMWVVTRDFLKSADTKIARTELDQKVRDYLGVTARNGSEALAQAKDLYDKLVAPIGGYLNRNLQLTIVPDDSLNFLPFATLVSSNSNRYLIEDYTLETTPSASVFIASTENGTRKGPKISERLLAVGNPSFDRGEFSNLSDLPGAKREVEAIAAAYGTSPLVGEKATAARVKEGLKENDIVHLATHALPDEKSPLLSKLLLAADRGEAHHANSGSLRASEVYELKLPRTRLVVLSACQTGIERSYRGEGAIGLARPFLSAGVPIVIASLWPVESEATANLMISFHKHRKQDHLSTVEALRRAQLETLHHLQSNSQTSYDWAAFIAIGGYAVY